MSRLRIVLAAGERRRRLNNSVVYAQLLFNAQRSPVVYGLEECEAYVRDVVEHASPDETLFHAIQLNSPARRNALRPPHQETRTTLMCSWHASSRTVRSRKRSKRFSERTPIRI